MSTKNTDGDCPTCAAHGKPHFGWCGWKDYGQDSGPQNRGSNLNKDDLCSDCPPENYPTDATRCAECPRGLEPSVLGAGDGPAPMPTKEEMRSAYRSAYMSYMRAQGVPEDFAIQFADAIDWQLVKDEKLTPEEMAHAEMEQWSAD